jgi:hypothetical protein
VGCRNPRARRDRERSAEVRKTPGSQYPVSAALCPTRETARWTKHPSPRPPPPSHSAWSLTAQRLIFWFMANGQCPGALLAVHSLTSHVARSPNTALCLCPVPQRAARSPLRGGASNERAMLLLLRPPTRGRSKRTCAKRVNYAPLPDDDDFQ